MVQCHCIASTEGKTIERELEKTRAAGIYEISPGIRLTCVQTDKFKTGCVSITLVTELSRDTAANNAIILRVLRRGCAKYQSMELISEALDNLYGTRIEPTVRKKGEMHCIGFYADFPDDRFVPDGNILEKAASLLADILLDPYLCDGSFRKEYVEGEKNNLIDDIRAIINDKRGYSISRLLEEMCADEAFGVNRLGCEDEAREITPEALTAHYRKLLASSTIEVFYCGSADFKRVESALRPVFDGLPEHRSPSMPKTAVKTHPPAASPKYFTETLDIVQSKLAVGFRLGQAMSGRPDYAALMVFNAVYGSGDSSKLFLNVRERLSLCYSIGSMLDKHKGVMVVASGVEFQKLEVALEEIQAQLGHIKNGEIELQELNSAKHFVTTSLKLATDSPGGLEELYFDSAVSLAPYDPVKLSEDIEAVDLADIIKAASDIKTDSVYFLTSIKGGNADDL